MTKTQLLANITRDRAALDALVASVDASRLTEPALEDGRSVKDVLAHVTAWEQLCLKWVREGQRQEVEFTQDVIDAVNQSTFDANRSRPLGVVMAESRASYDAIIAMVTSTDADLDAPPAWAQFPLGEIISENTYAHYREHIDQISRWLQPAKR